MMFSVCLSTTRATTLGAAIASIQRQTWSDWELIVVGQGEDTSSRHLIEAAGRHDTRLRYVHLAQRGLSLARNAGVQAARGTIIAMLDDDCEAHPSWLATLAACFHEEPEVGLVGGALLAPPRSRRRLSNCPQLVPAEALYDPVAMGRQAPPGWDWVGGNFAVRRGVIDRVGAFDPYLGAGAPFPSAEDTDFKLRLEGLGVKMRSTPRAIVHHTYGTRYGLQAVIRHARNYARGNGGLAGKLTLLGDPRGREWLELTRRECTVDWLRRPQPQRLPANLSRLWHFTAAYHQCLREYRVDPLRHVLYPVGNHSAACPSSPADLAGSARQAGEPDHQSAAGA